MTIFNAGDFGFSTAGQLPGNSDPVVARHRGRNIRQDKPSYGTPSSGFYWDGGSPGADMGFFDTIEEARAAIDDDCREPSEDEQRALGIEPPEDTPCLDRPWWETER